MFSSKEEMAEFFRTKLDSNEDVKVKTFNGEHFNGRVVSVGLENVSISCSSFKTISLEDIAEVE